MPRVPPDQLAARRRHILDAARTAFARHGFEGATVRVLEEQAGLSRGAIFHHYADKDALFLALAEADVAAMATTVAEQGLVQVMRDLIADPDPGWLGTQLEIDDFGTGYSSISYLRRLPIDAVKVDRSLIQDLGTAEKETRFVESVLRLIESVGKDAVVEGVETREQVELLRSFGCRRAQGYYFGRPMVAEEIARRLRAAAL